MLDLARELLPLVRAGTSVAAVTVTHVARSAPRGVGAAMAVTADATVIGSISGGCVESDAVALALSSIADGRARTAQFGFTDADAHAAGLACGGHVEVIAHVVDAREPLVLEALTNAAADRPATLAVVATGPHAGRSVPVAALRASAPPSERGLLDDAVATHDSRMLRSAYDGADVLVLAHAPRARLIILGAGEHAAALCRVGAASGFAVTVCDPWETLVTAERFPAADRLAVCAPAEFLASIDPAEVDARTTICVLTHDERLDVPAIRQALSMPVGFVGAMGARLTVARRAALLHEAGVSDVDLARLHSPLGLDLSGSSPDEAALSVLAEIVASRHGGSGRPLRETTGRLHRNDVPVPAHATAAAGCALPEQARP
ncbi:XdhC family protein [Microbacterium awajiense]|uniref:XdhC family protein n=1 Tax=Microbacterium awajiense TaxID=415214 RepID=A0ABP7ANN6_9MICO